MVENEKKEKIEEREVQAYEAPRLTVIQVPVEKGFAASNGYNGFGDETNW